MMRHCSCGALLALLAVTAPVTAQTAPAHPPLLNAVSTPHRSLPVEKPAPARKLAANAARAPRRPGVTSGTWIKLNTHLLGKVGEATWVNLAQAANIRFYQAGQTSFAVVGTGGSSYVSTSDPVEIRTLRAYVLARQVK